MKIRNKDMDIIVRSVESYAQLKSALGRIIAKNSTLYSYLSDKSEELKIIISAISKIHYENVKRYFEKLTNIKVFINGNDLKDLKFKPSENFKIILDKILKLKLDGVLKTREEELKKAKEISDSLSTPGI